MVVSVSLAMSCLLRFSHRLWSENPRLDYNRLPFSSFYPAAPNLSVPAGEDKNLWGYSVQFSHSVVSESLQPHGLQHARLLCPSPTPGACSNSWPLRLWCHPAISSSVIPLLLLPSIFPSIRVFFNESVLHIKWSKYWSFRFSISPSNEYSGQISFRIDWFGIPAVQKTLKSLLQYQNSKASILQCSAFFTVQLLHPYMTTGKTIVLTRWTFVDIMVIWIKSPMPVRFSSGIPKISKFTLAISRLTTSNLPWFVDLTLQVPMQYFCL